MAASLIMLLALAALPASLRGEAFTPREVRLGDPRIDYFNVELSTDMKYICWQNRQTKEVWVAGLDPETGDMIPSDGKGLSLGLEVASPQWGVDDQGSYLATMTGPERSITIYRFRSLRDFSVETLPVPPEPSRMWIYPSRFSNRPDKLFVYTQKTRDGVYQLFYLDAAEPKVEHQITTGRRMFEPIGLQDYWVTVSRWLPESPVLLFGFIDPATGKLQMMEVDTSQKPLAPRLATNGSDDLIDAFPTKLFGEPYLVAGLNVPGKTGALLARTESGNQYRPIETIDPQGTTYKNPYFTLSYEAFQWAGRAYASFQICDTQPYTTTAFGPLGQIPCEIWLTSLFDNSRTLRKISAPPSERIIIDPEYFIGNSKVWLFYYGKNSVSAAERWGLYRAETGLEVRPDEVVVVSAASYSGYRVSPGSVVTMFGQGISTLGLSSPAAGPLFELGGVAAAVTDSEGRTRSLPLLSVSPTQVNVVMPDQLADGPAVIRITRPAGPPLKGSIQIERVSPALFTADGSGFGLAAATVETVAADGSRTVYPIAEADGSGRVRPLPIDLSDESKSHYLTLYGTGLRGAREVSRARVTIAGVPATILYVGLQAEYPGLDQMNVLLPKQLPQQGIVDIRLQVEGKAANTVQVSVR